MTKKAEHMKYKEGAKRSFRPNEWYINKQEEREVNNFLAGSKGGVPNNPQNIRSFQPVPAPADPAGDPGAGDPGAGMPEDPGPEPDPSAGMG